MLVQAALGQTGPEWGGGLVPVGSTCLLSYRRKHAFIKSYHRLQTGPMFRLQQAHQLTDVDLMEHVLHKKSDAPQNDFYSPRPSCLWVIFWPADVTVCDGRR